GGGACCPTGIQGNECDHHPKDDAFDNAVEHIVNDVNAVLHLGPKSTWVNANEQDPNNPSTNNADRGKNCSQNRHGDNTPPKPRDQDPSYGVHRHYLHGSELFACFHQADFSSE